MHTKPSFFFRRYSILFFMMLSISILSCCKALAEQVVISPDKVNAPTFKTSTASCIGLYKNTHINLGFGTSWTGNLMQSNSYCTVGGGYGNTASGEASAVGGGRGNTAWGYNSVVGGGYGNKANGNESTVGGGSSNTASGFQSTIGGGNGNTASGEASAVVGGRGNIAGGDYSWAGGKYMQLTNTAHHTFVWGYSASPESISTLNAFLIFPKGTATGKVGIGTDVPKYTLDVIGNIRATGSVYYGGSSGNVNGTAYNKPDFVFEKGYKVMSTEQVAKHLEQENSLPWITSLKQEKEENGPLIDMTRMSFETVEAVENLQIQIIKLSKLIKEQQRQIDYLLNKTKH